MMKIGVKVWGLIVVLSIVVSVCAVVASKDGSSESRSFIDEEMKGEWLREYSGGAVDGSYAESKVSNSMPVGANPYGTSEE